jgi:hypothetical protein
MAAEKCIGGVRGGLFFFRFGCDGFQIFGFEDLLAVEAFEEVHTVAAGDDYRSFVVAGCLHSKKA